MVLWPPPGWPWCRRTSAGHAGRASWLSPHRAHGQAATESCLRRATPGTQASHATLVGLPAATDGDSEEEEEMCHWHVGHT